jgi:5-methylcytosine-specific restriction endonuclease McrA
VRNFNKKQRRALYNASGGRCCICKSELAQGWHSDHVIPFVHGGKTDVLNGQALCPKCNLTKGSKNGQKKGCSS